MTRTVLATMALATVTFLSQAHAETTLATPATAFLLESPRATVPLSIEFHHSNAQVGPTRLNEENGEFRTFLTPISGNPAHAEFSFWPQGDVTNRCHFKASFSSNGLASVSVPSQGKAHCWTSTLSPNFYILHADFDTQSANSRRG